MFRRILLKIGILRGVATLAQFLGSSLAPVRAPTPSGSSRGLIEGPGVRDAKDPDCVVFLCIGDNLVHFLSNAVKSLRRHEPEVAVYVFCEGHSRDLYVKATLGLDVSVRVIPAHTGNRPQNYAPYGTSEFNHATNLKWAVVSQLLTEGYGLVVFSDVDVVFLNSFVEYLRECSRTFPAGFQSEGQATFPPVFCTGFMYFTRSWQTQLGLLAQFGNTSADIMNDQDALNALIASSVDLQREVYELPSAIFPNGLLRPIVESYLESRLPGVPIFLFHANFCRGLKEKEIMLDGLGLWNPG